MTIFVDGEKINFIGFQPQDDGELSSSGLAPYLGMTLSINEQSGIVNIGAKGRHYRIDLYSSGGKYGNKFVEVKDGVELSMPNSGGVATAYMENGELISNQMFLMEIYDQLTPDGWLLRSGVDENEWSNTISITTDIETIDSVTHYNRKKKAYDFIDPRRWLDIRLTKPEAYAVYQQAQEITMGITEPYKKAEAIHRWVSENIFYDYDSQKIYSDSNKLKEAQDRSKWTKDSHGYNKYSGTYVTLKSKTGVCQSYAGLMTQLLKASNIPSRRVFGQIKGVNHEIVEFYVEGTWYIADPTWDSRNRFENGKFIKKTPVLNHFGLTPEQYIQKSEFICDHTVNDEYGSGTEYLTYEDQMEFYGLESEYDLK